MSKERTKDQPFNKAGNLNIRCCTKVLGVASNVGEKGVALKEGERQKQIQQQGQRKPSRCG